MQTIAQLFLLLLSCVSDGLYLWPVAVSHLEAIIDQAADGEIMREERARLIESSTEEHMRTIFLKSTECFTDHGDINLSGFSNDANSECLSVAILPNVIKTDINSLFW